MNARPSVAAVLDDKKFKVSCKAADENSFCVATDTLSVAVSQRIRRDTAEEMWESVAVYAREDEEGTLVVCVLVFNPDWEEPLQIASIRSRPRDGACLTALACNLDHVMP